MPRAKKRPDQCKALSESSHKRCKREGKAVGDDGYCAQHRANRRKSGANTPEGKARQALGPMKNGLFARSYTAEELEYLENEMDVKELASLDNEIVLCKIQIRRCGAFLRAEYEGDEDYDPLKPFLTRQDLDEVAVDEKMAPIASGTKKGANAAEEAAVPTYGKMSRSTTRRAPDLHRRLNDLLGHLRRLVATRKLLLDGNGGGIEDPQDAAIAIREAMQALDDNVGLTSPEDLPWAAESNPDL